MIHVPESNPTSIKSVYNAVVPLHDYMIVYKSYGQTKRKRKIVYII